MLFSCFWHSLLQMFLLGMYVPPVCTYSSQMHAISVWSCFKLRRHSACQMYYLISSNSCCSSVLGIFLFFMLFVLIVTGNFGNFLLRNASYALIAIFVCVTCMHVHYSSFLQLYENGLADRQDLCIICWSVYSNGDKIVTAPSSRGLMNRSWIKL